MEDHLVQLLKDKRNFVCDEFVRFTREKGGSKYRSIDEDIARFHISVLIDKLIISVEQSDPSVIKQYTQTLTEDRLDDDYDPDAVIQVWEWGEDFLTRLIKENLGNDPSRAEYERLIHNMTKTAKLVIAEATVKLD